MKRIALLLGVVGSILVVGPPSSARAASPRPNAFAPATIDPTEGPSIGGTTVTVTGAGLAAVSAVGFDGVAAADVHVVDDKVLTAVTPALAAGFHDVAVTTPDGVHILGTFRSLAPLTLTGVSSRFGDVSGGALVSLTGTGFSTRKSVSFGGTNVNSAHGFVSVADTTMTVRVPAHAPGLVDVTVKTASGESAILAEAFSYTSVTPTSGSSDGGTTVAVTVAGLASDAAATAVTFDGIDGSAGPAATNLAINATGLTVVTPALTSGNHAMTLRTPEGLGVVGIFTALGTVSSDSVTVTGVTPDRADPNGLVKVTVTGTGFTTAKWVKFGGLKATPFTIDADAQITATVPAHAAGTVDVEVMLASGAAFVLAAGFTYVPRPAVLVLAPAYAPAAGGQPIVVQGARFTGATSVGFGDVSVPCGGACQVISDSEIVVTAPVHPVGAVDLTVTTPSGTSSPVEAATRSTFAFYAPGTVSPVGACTTPEGPCTATVMAALPDGRILAVGTDGAAGATRLFDPAKGTWAPTGVCSRCSEFIEGVFIPVATVGATLTVLEGPPSVCGGNCGKVLLAGGEGFGSTYAALYNPLDGTWADVDAMRCARARHTATLLATGKVLVVGGDAENGDDACQATGDDTSASVELFNPSTATWSDAADLPRARSYHAATRLANGTVLVVGGICGECRGQFQPEASAEVYDPVANAWSDVASIGQPRWSLTLTPLLDGRVLAAGGQFQDVGPSTPETLSDVAEVYDPGHNSWTPVDPLTFRRAGHAAVRLPDGRVLVIGGDQNDAQTPYDAVTPGFHGNQATIGEVFDPADDQWTPGPPALVLARRANLALPNVQAVPLPCGDGCNRVLVTRGADTDSITLADPSSVLYDPPARILAPPHEGAPGSGSGPSFVTVEELVTLPNSGAQIVDETSVALALLGAGAGLVLVGFRRRARSGLRLGPRSTRHPQ